MTRPLASLWLTILLAVALAAGAVAQATAFPASDRAALHEIVICADGHEAVVLVDADGRPVNGGAACLELDCADCPRLSIELSAPEAFAMAERPAVARRDGPAGEPGLFSANLPRPSARGPPEKV